MRTVAVVLAVAGLLGGCGGSDAPKESPPEKTPAADTKPSEMSRADVERAVLEQTGAVALKCEQEPDAPERWFCRQGDEEKGWYAVVQPDGSVTLE